MTLVLAFPSGQPAFAAAPSVGGASIVPYIIGGQEALISQFPWQVFVLLEAEGSVFSCGGSIIDPTHILTAAHCVDHEGATTPYPAGDMLVIAGASRVVVGVGYSPASAQLDGVASFRTDPYYTVLPDIKDDVAVLTLEEPLELSAARSTQAISLVASGATPVAGTSLMVSGYGKEDGSEGAQPDGKLYSTTLTAISSDACRNTVGVNSAVLLCAESSNSATCQGDSGGPLTEGNPTVQVGIVDFGPKGCPTGQPDGFTNVAAPEIRDFIEGSESPPVAPRPTSSPVIKSVGPAPIALAPLTCEPGAWSGSPTFTYTFQVENASAQVLQNAPGNIFTPPSTLVGSPMVCIVQATNPGGTGTARSGTTPALTTDTTPPSTVIGKPKCKLQACIVAFSATDINGVTLSVASTAAYSVVSKCPKKKGRKASKKAVCHKTKTLNMSVKTLAAGSFQAGVTRLPYGEKITFTVAATNAAGLKAKPASASVMLHKPTPKRKPKKKKKH